MNISIIGSGHMALALATSLQRAGHTVRVGSRNPENRRSQLPNVAVASRDEVLADSEVVVLALPFTAAAPVARQYASQLRGKLVIDISNPFDHLPDNRVGGAELTAEAIGAGARVVAAFKTNFAATLGEPVDPASGLVRDVLLAGDSGDDKAIVTELVKDLGFHPVDCGALHNSRILDGMVPLLIELNGRYSNTGPVTSWKFLG